MTQLTENISLKNFYVYNSTYGPIEGEEEKKILYYYPSHINIENQIKDVGLSEAIVKFTNTFTSDEFCESLHTQKTRQLFFQPEKNFWMIMTINVPHAYVTRDGKTYCEYHGDDVQDSVLRAVLKQSYDTYKLFRGTFKQSLERGKDSQDTSVLKQELKHFFSKYVLTLRLPYCDVLDAMRGMQLMPLDSLGFLRVQTFVNRLEAAFPVVRRSAFLHNELLVWSGVESADMQIIYTHLVTALLPAHLELELQRCLIKPAATTSNTTNNSSSSNQSGSSPTPPPAHLLGQFVTGALFSNDSTAAATADGEEEETTQYTRVHLRDGGVYKLVVYKMLSCTVCLFVDASQNINKDLLHELNAFMSPQLLRLGSDIVAKSSQQQLVVNFPSSCSSALVSSNGPLGSSSSSEATGGANSPRYLYYNEIDQAYRTTLHRDNRKMGNLAVTGEVMRLIADLYAENSCTSNETILKTSSDYWVIGNSSNRRCFYVVLQQKNTNLIEISNEFKRVCDKELKYVFFQN